MKVEEKGLKLSIREGGKERQSKVVGSCFCQEERFQECSKEWVLQPGWNHQEWT